MNMTAPIRICLVGAGHAGKVHANTIVEFHTRRPAGSHRGSRAQCASRPVKPSKWIPRRVLVRLDSVILTDSTKLVQILSNLINNAIKFTKKGRIDFGYVLKDNFLEFYVKDTGIGIPPKYHSLIFERFYQVDRAVSRQYSGTGLGLSICKGYVELIGGTIRVESEPGKGTRFVFTIPYSRSLSFFCIRNLYFCLSKFYIA